MLDQAPATPLSPASDGPVAGATLVIEAPTAEEALTQLHEQLGADARIIEVRRVARGGIGGFFAREMVELHAAPGAAAGPGAPAPAPSPTRTPAAAAASPIDRLLRDEIDTGAASGAETVDFATYLRGQLGDPVADAAPATAVEAPTSTHEALLERATAVARLAVRSATGERDGGGVVDPTLDGQRSTSPVADVAAVTGSADPVPAAGAVQVLAPMVAEVAEVVAPTATATATTTAMAADLTEPAPATEAGPAWSVANLIKLGLPAGLVRGLEVAAPSDDVAWTAALAGALRPVCRPLPSGKNLLIGPRARSVANGLGVTSSTVGQPIRSRATTVAVAVGSGVAGRRWLERVRGARWLHLVVGGNGWRELLHLDPLAVSWASDADVPEAIRLATELGLVLGGGPLGRQVQRARPLDVALAVRELLPVTRGVAATTDAEGGR